MRTCAGFLVGILTVGLVACAGESVDTDSAAAEINAVKLDTVVPADVEAAAKLLLDQRLEVLVTAHPDMKTISAADVEAFTSSPRDSATGDLIRTLLAFAQVNQLTVDGIKTEFAKWIPKQVAAGTNSAGNVLCEQVPEGYPSAACHRASDEKAFTTAKPPAGIDMAALAADWELSEMNGDAKRPVKLVGTPAVRDIKEHAGVRSWCKERGWGAAAVDALVSDSPKMAKYADALKGRGFAKRWYWSCGGDSWGESGFALVDEHDQLWAFNAHTEE